MSHSALEPVGLDQKDHALPPLKNEKVAEGPELRPKSSFVATIDTSQIQDNKKETNPDAQTAEPCDNVKASSLQTTEIVNNINAITISNGDDDGVENKTEGDYVSKNAHTMNSEHTVRKTASSAVLGSSTSPVRTSFFHKHFRKEVDNIIEFITQPLPKDMGYANFTISNFQHNKTLEQSNVWELRLVDKRIRYVGDAQHGNFLPGETQTARRASLADFSHERILLVARSRLEGSHTNFHVSLAHTHMRHPQAEISGPRVLGTVHADDFKSTIFTGYTAGQPGSKAKDINNIRSETLHIAYEHLHGTPFRRTRVVIPAVQESSEGDVTVVSIKDDGSKKKYLEAHLGNVAKEDVINFTSPQPIVDSSTRRASLDFGGKLVDDYDYNLQLIQVDENNLLEDQPAVTLLKKNTSSETHYFDMSARYPMSILQAFQIAISTFENASLDQIAG